MPSGNERPLRVAVAGAGWVSEHHLRGWARVPFAEVVSICDPDDERAVRRATAFGVPDVQRDAATMLDAVRPDTLDICAPPNAHAALCALAAARGIATMCQKPLASTLSEARRIAAIASGRMRLMVHENWRFRAPYRQVQAWLQEGCIGNIVTYRLHSASAGLLPDANGRLPALVRQPLLSRLPRLAIGESLIHHLDVTRWLLGPLTVVAARNSYVCPEVAGDDSATIELASNAGIRIEVSGTFSDPAATPTGTDHLHIEGTTGRIEFDGRMLELAADRLETHRYDPEVVYADSYAGAIAHFADCLRTGTSFETSVDDNLRTLALVETAYRLAARN